jgi:hypothetical protein
MKKKPSAIRPSKPGLSVKDMLHNISPEHAALRSENEELKRLLQAQKLLAGEQSEIVAEILAATKVATPPKLAYTPAPPGKVSSPVALVGHLTDWHIGMVTEPTEIEHFGANNFALATARSQTFGGRLINEAELHRSVYGLDELVLLCTGDFISGDIHEELLRTNEFPPPVQAVKAGYLLGGLIQMLAPHFARIRIEFLTPGNHDRLTKKPQKSEGGFNSWGFVVGHIAKQYVSALPGVEFNIHAMLEQIVTVAGWRYLITHGNGIIGTWGIPYYGVDRRKQREAMARMNMPEKRHFHKIVLGHFHSALNHEHWQIGGSLTGTDANDHSQGRHALPHQTAWFVHPKHGEFGWTRFWL